MAAPAHLTWLVPTGTKLKTQDGKEIELWEVNHAPDPKVLSAWAKHFRGHYCDDAEIDILRQGTPHPTRGEYLTALKFPDAKQKPGPGIRSGDFAEILVADYLEYVLGFWVPRTRYEDKTVRNESTKGSDVIGFAFRHAGQVSPSDTLFIFESKAQLSGNKAKTILQEAIDHSAKDELRRAESLNAVKQRLLKRGDLPGVAKVARFQDVAKQPYQSLAGAAALFTTEVLDHAVIRSSDAAKHTNRARLSLLVISGPKLMDLVHHLYTRAADEA
jgi:hypothetical protein